MKASSTKMEPTGGSTKDLIVHKVDPIMPPHAIISWIASCRWISTRPSRYTLISHVPPIPRKSGLSWLLWMVCLHCIPDLQQSANLDHRYYYSGKPPWLRSVIDAIPDFWIKKLNWMEVFYNDVPRRNDGYFLYGAGDLGSIIIPQCTEFSRNECAHHAG